MGFDRRRDHLLRDDHSRAVAARYDALTFIPWGFMDAFYAATVQATEEAVVNALVANGDVTGFRGHRTPGLPRERAVAALRERGVIA